jgi:hypothetical protein
MYSTRPAAKNLAGMWRVATDSSRMSTMTTTARSFDSLARRKARLPEPEPEKYSQQIRITEEGRPYGG